MQCKSHSYKISNHYIIIHINSKEFKHISETTVKIIFILLHYLNLTNEQTQVHCTIVIPIYFVIPKPFINITFM